MVAKVVYVRKLCPKTGEFVELPEFYLDGRRVTRREYRRAVKDKTPSPRAVAAPGAWPKNSVAGFGIDPRQVAEANAANAAAGLASYYRPDGTAVIPSRAEQKKLTKFRGMYNKNDD